MVVPTSAWFSLCWWEIGRIGWAVGQGGETSESKSTQPNYATRCTTMYLAALTYILINGQRGSVVCRPVVVVLFQHLIEDVRLDRHDESGSRGGHDDQKEGLHSERMMSCYWLKCRSSKVAFFYAIFLELISLLTEMTIKVQTWIPYHTDLRSRVMKVVKQQYSPRSD